MLVMPPTTRPFTVMGIDPGTSTLGVSILSWDLRSPRYRVEQAFTLKATNNTQGYGAIEELHGGRMARLQQHHDEVLYWLHCIRPQAVIAESPYQGRFAQTFAALTECLAIVRQALMAYDSHLPLYQVEPNVAKQSAGVDLSAMRRSKDKKEIVRTALATRTDIIWGVSLDSMDEHAVDATAVGLHYFRHLI